MDLCLLLCRCLPRFLDPDLLCLPLCLCLLLCLFPFRCLLYPSGLLHLSLSFYPFRYGSTDNGWCGGSGPARREGGRANVAEDII
ncbi:hypothetical protein FIBSPDRAFT_847233 [Athelia psychrophila]|uniref:Uncharacterized protein n=1 Tax=Athelia psychrophila TaxID=1759441 RepID=A0A166WTT3_9AGAM|nr:hypothetical protein FIBSPDRAFT_859855 [Fibularhizoctonia sp. CBS 109695]KZP34101.1 hypothetical protein FIBSPDRAFT_847233 [Fibularhizoctonia sp. CBS 109695]